VHSGVSCAKPNIPIFDYVHDSELTFIILHVMCVLLFSLFILNVQNDCVELSVRMSAVSLTADSYQSLRTA